MIDLMNNNVVVSKTNDVPVKTYSAVNTQNSHCR